jgi:hypothetical protein
MIEVSLGKNVSYRDVMDYGYEDDIFSIDS